jgi:hypothetical protein
VIRTGASVEDFWAAAPKYLFMHRTTLFLSAASAALAITTAPIASASRSEQPCSDVAGSTNCQRPGNAQVYTAPRALPRLLPPTINPRWRALGHSARYPKIGFDPKWQAFGYNPKYSGFQPRPSVLRAPQLPVLPDTTDTGGSTTDQTPGNAQLTAQIGLAAQQSDPPQYPLSGTTTDAGGASTYQWPGNAQITTLPGPAAQTAAGQSRFFGVIGLPRA